MSPFVVGYQIFLFVSMYWATYSFGFLGYFAAVLFWGVHTLTKVMNIRLLLLQGLSFGASAYLFWPEAARDAHDTMISIGRFVTGNLVVILVVVFGGVVFLASLFYYSLASGPVHDAAINFGHRISHFLSGSKQAKEVCKDLAMQQLGVDQFASLGERAYIKVPYDERFDARQLGARWDAARKCWYIPKGVDARLFSRWRSE